MHQDPQLIMERAGVKPTSNRVLILRTLLNARSPMSLIEIEKQLDTLERSSILRVLTLFHEHDIIHTIEDGRGVTKYEICRGENHCSVSDMHPHFYCERCNRVYCFDDIATPQVSIPADFRVRTVNYMLKGICPDCARKEQ